MHETRDDWTPAELRRRRRIWRLGLMALSLVAAGALLWALGRVPRDIEARASAALERAGTDPRVRLTAAGRTLILEGEIGDRFQRARAAAIARSVAGVREVVDRLAIEPLEPAPESLSTARPAPPAPAAAPPPAAAKTSPTAPVDRPEAASVPPAPPPEPPGNDPPGGPPAAATAPSARPWQPPVIRFAVNSARLSPANLAALRRVAAELRGRPGLCIEIAGHADALGPEAHNFRLSARRAAAVARHLVQAGIDPERLFPRAYGAERPLADNRSAAGRAANRRVELVPSASSGGYGWSI